MEMIRREIFTVPEIVKNSPHTARVVSSTEWVYNYTREQAAYPVEQTNKFLPAVSRITMFTVIVILFALAHLL